MPRPLIFITLIIIAVGLLPPAIVFTMWTSKKSKPRIHLVQDMDNQGKFRAQQENPRFEDDRAMRMPVEGTVARGGLGEDDHYYTGRVDGQWAEEFPLQVVVDEELLSRGRERFEIYCLPCHGMSGHGDGVVDRRARDLLVNSRLGKGTVWTRPRNLHEDTARVLTVGEIFDTITNGKNNMAAYGPQIPVKDRWAIVAWVRTLQRSQNASVEDLGYTPASEIPTVDLTEAQAESELESAEEEAGEQ